MHAYLDSLSTLGGGGWHIGDISLAGGKKSPKHKSHQKGTDVDIGIPTLGGGSSVVDNRKGSWRFRNIRPSQLDIERALIFLRHAFRSGAKFVFLDKHLERPIKIHAQSLVASGDMSKAEFKTVFRRTQHVSGHANHFHVRLGGTPTYAPEPVVPLAKPKPEIPLATIPTPETPALTKSIAHGGKFQREYENFPSEHPEFTFDKFYQELKEFYPGGIQAALPSYGPDRKFGKGHYKAWIALQKFKEGKKTTSQPPETVELSAMPEKGEKYWFGKD